MTTTPATFPTVDEMKVALNQRDADYFQELLQSFFSVVDTDDDANDADADEIKKAAREADAESRSEALTQAIAATQPVSSWTPDMEHVFVDTIWLHWYMDPTATTKTTTTTTTAKKQEKKKERIVALLKALRESMLQKSMEVDDEEDANNDSAAAAETKEAGGGDSSSKGKTTATTANNNNNRLEELLVTQLDAGLLQQSGWIDSEKELAKRLRLFNTQHFYKQHKFNVLAEESEGYAKFLAELVKLSSSTTKQRTATNTTTKNAENNENDNKHGEDDEDDDDDDENDPQTLRRYRIEQQLAYLDKIIGTFNLDPNRCLDLTIDVMEFLILQRHKQALKQQQKLQQQQQQNQNKQQQRTQQVSSSSLSSGFSSTTTNIPLNASTWLPLLKRLPTTHLPSLLAFKLKGRQTLQTSTSSAKQDESSKTANSSNNNALSTSTTNHASSFSEVSPLFHTMLWLVQQEILDVHEMMASINPNWREVLADTYKALYKQEKERVRDLGRVRLNAAVASPTGGGGEGDNEGGGGIPVVDDSHHKSKSSTTQPLRESLAFQWILVFLEEFHWDLIEPVLDSDQWSQLSFVLTDTVALAICDWTQRQIQLHSILAPPPWAAAAASFSTSNKSGSKTKAEEELEDHDKRGTPNKRRAAEVQHHHHTENIEDFIMGISRPLSFVMDAGCISNRPILFCQLCRILCCYLNVFQDSSAAAASSCAGNGKKEDGRKSPLKQRQENDISLDILDFIKTFLLPSMSAFICNPSLSLEVWNVLVLLPTKTRYNLYNFWRGSALERDALSAASAKPLWLIEGEIKAGKDSRYALKRLSKDTIRDMSRAVAKVCHSHPLVVFTTILNQIESYDNMVQVMVDALRFVTPLSLDVLSFCILNRLSGNVSGGGMVNRSLLKEDGVNVSQWLQSLEAFVGSFYMRFPFIDFRAIICYLMGRLKNGHVMELGVLRTLLKRSAGWAFADYAPAASLSTTQLEGRAGSTLLKQETMSFGIVEEINLRASNEVRRILQSDDMGVSMLILLAQVRNQIIFGTGRNNRPKPVKLIANLVDNCQVILSILLDFLTTSGDEFGPETHRENTSLAVYAKSLPSLIELHDLYGMDVAWAWMLCRPVIRAAFALERKSESMEEEDGEEKDHGSAIGGAGEDSNNPLNDFKSSEANHSFYKSLFEPSVWEQMSTVLFEIFYSNALYDISCPDHIYKAEIARLDKESERLAQQAKTPTQNTQLQPGTPVKTDEEERERVIRASARLTIDSARQEKHVQSIRKMMDSRKTEYFSSNQVSSKSASTFLSRCIFPRCLQGPDDALYCARFVSILHEEATPGFGTLHFFDELFVSVSRTLYGLTEGEASNVSILFFESWKTVSRWRYNEEAFNKEVEGKPGSYLADPSGDSLYEPEPVDFKGYETLYNKWHAAVGSVAIGCLKSPEYIHTRNCLIVLTRIVEVFPTRPGLANLLVKTLTPLQDESNSLADIRASALAYGKQLLRARDDGVWKEESAATVKARQAREKTAAAERQKKAKKNMEDIKREAEKITEEIGWDSRSRGDRRPAGGGGGPSGGGGSTQTVMEDGRILPGPVTASNADNSRRSGPTFEPPPPRPPTEDKQRTRGLSVARELPSEDRWNRGRSQSRHNDRQHTPGDSGNGNSLANQRGLEDRWQRAGPGGGGGGDDDDSARRRESTKRSRPASPMEDGETAASEDSASRLKRSRPETESMPRVEEGGRGSGGARRRRNQRR